MSFLKNIFFVGMLTSTHLVSASWLPSFSNDGILEFMENGPSWVPKPYKIPISQGSLLKNENLSRLSVGLSKDQVKFLLGTPSIIDTFHSDRWDYVFYDRNTKNDEIKKISIIFVNEKLREINIGDEDITDSEMLSDNNYIKNAPVQLIPKDKIIQELIVAKRADYLTMRSSNNLPVCIDDEFENYESQKTLVQADEDTLEVRSDEQNQDEDGIFIAKGNVEIERINDLVKADEAKYNADTGLLYTEGNVKYLSEDLTLYAEEGGYNSQNDTVNFSSTQYFFPEQKKPGKGKAEEIFIDDDGIIYLTPSSYTTCALNNPDWELSSSKTILYREDDRGHAYNMFLKYKGVPILYSPFVSFPLSRERHSGFLLPSVGSSGESGSVVSTPYYFNIAENLDLTIKPTNFSGRGLMMEGELRYKTGNSNTVIEMANLKKDDVYGKGRHAYFIRDDRIFSSTLKQVDDKWVGTEVTSSINVGGISDINYFDDFSNSVSRVGRTHITRDIKISRIDYNEFGYFSSSIGATDYQLAKSGLNEQYSVLPRIKLNYTSPRKNKQINYNFEGEIAKFDHTMPNKATGTRTILYPSIEYPVSHPGWEINSKIGIRHSDYRLNANLSGFDKEEISKTFPILSLRGKMIFEKMTTNNILQTLEPEMFYLYVPAGNQSDIPIFDSGDVDFKYNLFSENKFYGNDRINDTNQITLALSSSMINTSTGTEVLRGTIGQIFYLKDRSVSLNNSETDTKGASNIMGLVNAKFNDYWRLTGYTEYDPYQNNGAKNQIRLSYKRPYGKQNQIFNTSYRFSRGSQEEIDFSAVVPVNNRFSLVGKINYSFNNRRSESEDVLEKMIGVEYESCCYGIKIVAREFWNGTKTDDVVYFEFLPKGIATSDNTTAELLREGILGYQDKFDY